jgi:hypothetical protein
MRSVRKLAGVILGIAIVTLVIRVAMKEKRFGLVLAGYNQFYVADDETGSVVGESTFWSKSAYDSRVAIGPGVVGVRTSSAVFVPVSIGVSEREAVSSAPYVVEAPLRITKGIVRVFGCPDHDPGIAVRVTPGDYTIRVEYSRVIEDGSEWWWHGDGYRITIFSRRSERPIILRSATRRPNQSPEPTALSVTPRADARVAPASTVAHL